MPKDRLTAELVRSVIDYNPETGEMLWKHRGWLTGRASTWNTRYAGRPVGTINGHGYISAPINKTRYEVHRLAWIHVFGVIPDGHIDHKNGIKTDNRIDNLRLTDRYGNAANVGISRRNKSGYKGVYRHKLSNKWMARIGARGKHYYLGIFENVDDAGMAYALASEKLHGEFSRLM